jgi:hypothetical protein
MSGENLFKFLVQWILLDIRKERTHHRQLLFVYDFLSEFLLIDKKEVVTYSWKA